MLKKPPDLKYQLSDCSLILEFNDSWLPQIAQHTNASLQRKVNALSVVGPTV